MVVFTKSTSLEGLLMMQLHHPAPPSHNNSAIYIGLMAGVVIICVMIIAYRLQKLAKQRTDAEQRATVAFEEMNRLTKELRDRKKTDPVVDPSLAALAPGERLRRMYPGPGAPRAATGGEDS